MSSELVAKLLDAAEVSEEIHNLVDGIIAGLEPSDFHEAINWGDLGCRAVEFGRVHYNDGIIKPVLTVLIEEASDDATKFCEYIEDRLFERLGKPDGLLVFVHTEW